MSIFAISSSTPSNSTATDVYNAFECHGRVVSVKRVENGWKIVYEDWMDSQDAKRALSRDGVKVQPSSHRGQKLPEEYFVEYDPINNIYASL